MRATPATGQVDVDLDVIAGVERSADVSVGRSPTPSADGVVRRLASQPSTWFAAAVLGVMVASAVIVPWFSDRGYSDIDLLTKNASPFSGAGVLGTDALGRDLLVRLAFGLRLSIVVVVVAVAIQFAVGLPVGVLAGWVGGRFESIVMRVVEVLLSVPTILFALVVAVNVKVVAEVGSGWWPETLRWLNRATLGLAPILVVLLLFSWLYTAQIVRAATMSAKDLGFVRAARGLGATPGTVLVRHVVPAVMPQVVVAVAIVVPGAVLTEASLSYFGLGVDPPVSSLGLMIAEGSQAVSRYPHLVLLPALTLVVLAVAVTVLAHNVRVAFDPRLHDTQRQRRLARPAPVPVAIQAGGSDSTALDLALCVRGLTVAYADGTVAVRGVDLDLPRSGRLAVVGESGSGKSTVAAALLGLLPSGTSSNGSIVIRGRAVGDPGSWQALRGRRIALVSQDPLRALDPLLTIGRQLVELIVHHRGLSRAEARTIATSLVREVGLHDAERVLNCRPHELSGGMRQRAVIAMAIAGEPDILVADEPTTALDVTVQAQILELLVSLSDQRGMALIIISHDLGVVAATAHEVAVMYAGRLVEHGDTHAVLTDPQHPYTAALLAAVPDVERSDQRLAGIPGAPPDPRALPPGCSFAPRCPEVTSACATSPVLIPVEGRRVSCHLRGGS